VLNGEQFILPKMWNTVIPQFTSLINSSKLLVRQKLVKLKLISEKRRREQ
jgi:hypothetical protein